MTDETTTLDVAIEHYIYGSYGGYKMKAQSSGVDPAAHTDPYKGYFFPITQADVKTLGEVRVILPAGPNTMLLARIVKGPRDDHGRETMANHTAIIPKHLLYQGILTYEDVDNAMIEFEKDGVNSIGKILPLAMPKSKQPADMSALKDMLSKDIVDNIINHYKSDKDRRIFLFYKGGDPAQRIKLAYLLSMLLDVKMGLIPLSLFTDKPYFSATNIFNLVISRVMANIKPGGEWVVMPVDASRVSSGATGDVSGMLKSIYG